MRECNQSPDKLKPPDVVAEHGRGCGTHASPKHLGTMLLQFNYWSEYTHSNVMAANVLSVVEIPLHREHMGLAVLTWTLAGILIPRVAIPRIALHNQRMRAQL